MSSTVRILATCISTLPLFVSPAAAQDCPAPQSNVDLELLYRYSQHAQAAYGEEPSNACDHPNLRAAASTALANTIATPLAEREYQNLELPGNPQVAVYRGVEGGAYFATCRRDDLAPGFAISILQTETPGDPPEHGFHFDLRRVFERPLAELLTEELLLVSSYEFADSTPPTRLFAVRGTELTWQRLLPNLLDLLSNSCVFEVAARIVESADNKWARPMAVTGHSLGGSVAQYVARDRTNRNSLDPDPFTAYSFNGVGLDAPIPNLPDLFSYQVDGEFVAQSESWFRRQQGGNAIRYLPPEDDWPMSSTDWPDVFRRAYLAKKRHELSVVQDSICKCAKGHGRIEYDGSRPR